MLRIEAILGIAAAVITLTAFFVRAWANWRSGQRVKGYTADIRRAADLEVERLKAEMAASERTLKRDSEREEK
jgi:hypothetical protein